MKYLYFIIELFLYLCLFMLYLLSKYMYNESVVYRYIEFYVVMKKDESRCIVLNIDLERKINK